MIKKPYYSIHQIEKGKYTSGGEFVTEDGQDYIGGYHILPNQQIFTGFIPSDSSEVLLPKRLDNTGDAAIFNKINERKISQYIAPVVHYPMPNVSDYKNGSIERFFVQKRNNPTATITEIDAAQYNKINSDNKPGINEATWNKLMILWKISNIPKDDIIYQNQKIISESENNFPGIGVYLDNILEFYKNEV